MTIIRRIAAMEAVLQTPAGRREALRRQLPTIAAHAAGIGVQWAVLTVLGEAEYLAWTGGDRAALAALRALWDAV